MRGTSEVLLLDSVAIVVAAVVAVVFCDPMGASRSDDEDWADEVAVAVTVAAAVTAVTVTPVVTLTVVCVQLGVLRGCEFRV